MKAREVPVGARFGRFVVLGEAQRKTGQARRLNVVCDCGNARDVEMQALLRGHTTSCGCYRTEFHTKHGGAKKTRHSRWYRAWQHMIERCTDPNDSDWSRYGGRGIRVCDRWMIPENFLADMGEPPEGRSIDRINNDGNYEPGNCRWATRTQQMRNYSLNRMVNHDGKVIPLAEACELAGVRYSRIMGRIRGGMDPESAIQLGNNDMRSHPNGKRWKGRRSVDAQSIGMER